MTVCLLEPFVRATTLAHFRDLPAALLRSDRGHQCCDVVCAQMRGMDEQLVIGVGGLAREPHRDVGVAAVAGSADGPDEGWGLAGIAAGGAVGRRAVGARRG